MSDDDLRDALGDSITDTLRARSVDDDGDADARVHRIVHRRRRARSAIVSGTAVLLVVALVAVLATARSTSRPATTTYPPSTAAATTTTEPVCPSSPPATTSANVTWPPIVRWHDTTYVAPTDSLLGAKLGAPVGRTCFSIGLATPRDFRLRDGDSTLDAGTQLFRVDGYTERAAIGVAYGGTQIFVAQSAQPMPAAAMLDLTSGVREIDVSKRSSVTHARLFAVAQITDAPTIARVRAAIERSSIRPGGQGDELVLTLQLESGATITFGVDALDDATRSDLDARYAATQRAVGTDGFFVGLGIAGFRLYNADGMPVSIVPGEAFETEDQLRVVDKSVGPVEPDGAGWEVEGIGDRPRPSGLRADCNDWDTAANVTVSVCAERDGASTGQAPPGRRVEQFGERGARVLLEGGADPGSIGSEGFFHPHVSPDGKWATVNLVPHQCGIWGSVVFDLATGKSRQLPPFGYALGFTADGQVVVSISNQDGCTAPDPPGLYLVDPASGAKHRILAANVSGRWFGPAGLATQ